MDEIDHKVRVACGLVLGDERVGEPVDAPDGASDADARE
jgi:recombination protein RecA